MPRWKRKKKLRLGEQVKAEIRAGLLRACAPHWPGVIKLSTLGAAFGPYRQQHGVRLKASLQLFPDEFQVRGDIVRVIGNKTRQWLHEHKSGSVR